jgi:hypothetical protein
MLVLRLLGLGLVLLGIAFVAPFSTRGPAFRLRRAGGPLSGGIEGFLTLRKWFARLIGLILIVGGVIYMVHPPHRIY